MTKRIFLTMLLVISLQIFLFNHFDGSKADLTGFLIVSGVPINNEFVLLGTWYMFFSGLSFLSLGYLRQYISGYGVYLMIREKSRVKLGISRIIKLMILISGLSLIQVLASIIFAYLTNEDHAFFYHDLQSFICITGLYIMTNFVLIFIQMALELYLTEQVSLLVINVYVLFSVTLGGVILSVQKLTWILYFLIPNFGMYVRVDLPESAGLSPVIAYMILTVISIIICAISYTRLKKMDLT
ncbi:DUF2705 family protein [Peribacillus castrilensis]|uniref:Uncharacterized protein n=2 Tax=root TaxID=1 RepID=A0AAN2PM10_9BACI|nr:MULTISPECIES: DUF2705 family protein [Bacillaceae]MCP1094943.1 DUF2705 family protein [Bacillaceae bacterium OS4b]MBD8587592.1 DUF2705 family protein [Peribacillus simplex]MCF7624816.1 DUF2705 family protein [Peribacillus frigoritolerans]MCP1155334.1 DUF2705 family protein [Peribacillus frigoritolerans]MCT1389743.1 DUF2705 family protein [Peribacillus frigoritolerans]